MVDKDIPALYQRRRHAFKAERQQAQSRSLPPVYTACLDATDVCMATFMDFLDVAVTKSGQLTDEQREQFAHFETQRTAITTMAAVDPAAPEADMAMRAARALSAQLGAPLKIHRGLADLSQKAFTSTVTTVVGLTSAVFEPPDIALVPVVLVAVCKKVVDEGVDASTPPALFSR